MCSSIQGSGSKKILKVIAVALSRTLIIGETVNGASEANISIRRNIKDQLHSQIQQMRCIILNYTDGVISFPNRMHLTFMIWNQEFSDSGRRPLS
ncbi:unnamed protein product [Rhodiola kirilowii]